MNRTIIFKSAIIFTALSIIALAFVPCFSTACAAAESFAVTVSDGRYCLKVACDGDFEVRITNTNSYVFYGTADDVLIDIGDYLESGENTIEVYSNGTLIKEIEYTISLDSPSALYFDGDFLHFNADSSATVHHVYVSKIKVADVTDTQINLSNYILSGGAYCVSVVSEANGEYSMPSYLNILYTPLLAPAKNLSVAYIGSYLVTWSKVNHAEGYILEVVSGESVSTYTLTQNYILLDTPVDSFTVTAFAEGYRSSVAEWPSA